MERAVLFQRLDRLKELHEKHRLFFVCGAPKSGTTWLQKALDAHPDIVCAGEGHFADKFASGLTQLFKQYYAHQAVVGQNVYEGRPYYRKATQEDFRFFFATFVTDVLSRLPGADDATLIGDKTPANVDYLRSLHQVFPEARFVNIVRDGRDVLVSLFKHSERVTRASGSQLDLPRFLLENTKQYTERWIHALKSAEEFADAHPGFLHTIRYEDLKSDFGNSFSGVLRFLDVDSSQSVVAGCEKAASFEALTGGRLPGQEDPSAFIRKGVVGDWKSNLDDNHLAIFYDLAESWMARWGYNTG